MALGLLGGKLPRRRIYRFLLRPEKEADRRGPKRCDLKAVGAVGDYCRTQRGLNRLLREAGIVFRQNELIKGDGLRGGDSVAC